MHLLDCLYEFDIPIENETELVSRLNSAFSRAKKVGAWLKERDDSENFIALFSNSDAAVVMTDTHISRNPMLEPSENDLIETVLENNEPAEFERAYFIDRNLAVAAMARLFSTKELHSEVQWNKNPYGLGD